MKQAMFYPIFISNVRKYPFQNAFCNKLNRNYEQSCFINFDLKRTHTVGEILLSSNTHWVFSVD